MGTDVFEALSEQVGVQDYHLMLVGDGSGMTRATPCGWCCHLYHRPSGRVRTHFGGASNGSNNFAELVPYLFSLATFHAAFVEAHPDQEALFNVLIVSDSELTVRCGMGEYARRANLALWASIDWFVANGYKLTWRHVLRNSNPVSKRSDAIAGFARKEVKEWDLP